MKKNLINKKKNQKGFTLVELIVVIAIIGVLVAMMVPSLMGYVNKAKEQKNNANARTIASTVQASNAAINVSVKAAEDKTAKLTRVGAAPWGAVTAADISDSDSIDLLNADSQEMISIDGSAYVEIDETGKVVKVVYSTEAAAPDGTEDKSDDTTGIWTPIVPTTP